MEIEKKERRTCYSIIIRLIWKFAYTKHHTLDIYKTQSSVRERERQEEISYVQEPKNKSNQNQIFQLYAKQSLCVFYDSLFHSKSLMSSIYGSSQTTDISIEHVVVQEWTHIYVFIIRLGLDVNNLLLI